MHIGIAGTGRMGAAIALRLIEQGHSLSVWNRTADKLTPLAAAGANICASPRQLASAVDVVLTILTDANAQHAVYSGAEGLLSGTVGGKLVIEMSTVQPHEIQGLAPRVEKAGAAFVECPVGGTTGPARQGKLLGLAGGSDSDVARARPLLDQLCRRVEHVGPVGAGASMKLAVNLPLMVYYQALGEALLLTRHLGLDPTEMMELMADTSGAPAVLKTRGPVIAGALAGSVDNPAAFDVESICKDLRAMVAEGRLRGSELPVAGAALRVFEDARAAGWGARDGTTLPAYFTKARPRSA